MKILLVEDSYAVRKATKECLENEGYAVEMEAKTKLEALRGIEEAKTRGINITILDRSLGGDNDDGGEIAKQLRGTVPGIKIISFSFTPVKWGDVNVLKPDFSVLIDTIDEFQHQLVRR